MKKCVVLSDSFKGSISSTEIGRIVREECVRQFTGCAVSAVPVADGGEGTAECFDRRFFTKLKYSARAPAFFLYFPLENRFRRSTVKGKARFILIASLWAIAFRSTIKIRMKWLPSSSGFQAVFYYAMFRLNVKCETLRFSFQPVPYTNDSSPHVFQSILRGCRFQKSLYRVHT